METFIRAHCIAGEIRSSRAPPAACFGSSQKTSGKMIHRRGYFGRPSLPSNVCTARKRNSSAWQFMHCLLGTECRRHVFCMHSSMHSSCREQRALLHGADWTTIWQNARVGGRSWHREQVGTRQSRATSIPPTLRSRLCFWMAQGTICQVPAAAKRNAATVCVAKLKHSHAAISQV